MANSTALSGGLFEDGGERIPLAIDSAQPGDEIALVVANTITTNEPRRFDAALFGREASSSPLCDLREFPLGFWKERVLPGDCVTVVSHPQVVYEPTRLHVPRRVRDQFAIHTMMVSTGDIVRESSIRWAGTGYSPPKCTVPWQVRLSGEWRSPNGHAWWTWSRDDVPGGHMVAAVANDVALVVENLTREPQTFRAAMVGRAAQ